LKRIFAERQSNDSISNIRNLMASIDTTIFSLFDQVIEDLTSQGLVYSSDGESYQITFIAIMN
jgi:hypothetical protein